MYTYAFLPYFGGQSSAAPSRAEFRHFWLEECVDSLRGLASHLYIGVHPSESTVPRALQDLTVPLDCDPRFIPSNLLRWGQENLPDDVTHVCVTESDQVWHYDRELLSFAKGLDYLVPWRLEQLGDGGEGSHRGENVTVKGKRYVVPQDGAPLEVLRDYGGAFYCSASLFRSACFHDADVQPVETATGWALASYGNSLKLQYPWQKFWVDHRSGYDYHQRMGGR